MRETLARTWPAVAVAGVVAGLFLAAGAATFPMDDAYIHAVYARNLAEHGALSFNLNPTDSGLGTTSILWPLLLAGLSPLVGVVAAARLLGLASYLALAVLATVIAGWMTPRAQPRAAIYCGVLVLLSGNLVWFSFSGMETMLWLSLGLGALVAYQRDRPVGLGILLGLLMLTRIEGVILLFSVAAIDLIAEHRLRRRLVLAMVIAGLLLAPWLGYVQARTGHWLPTSYSGKKHAQVRGAISTVNQALGKSGDEVPLDEQDLPAWTNLIYPLGVLGYGFAFVAGGIYLPGPRIPMGGQIGEIIGGLSLTALLLLLGLFAPLFWRVFRRAWQIRGQLGEASLARRALFVLALWFLLHNLAYWLKLPTPGTASRYQVVNHFAWWILAGAGVWRVAPERGRKVLTAVVLSLALWNLGYWWTVYASDIRHMREVRLAAAEYIRDELPPDAIIAAHDIGALGWAMERRTVDLGGLIDPGWLAAAKVGAQADFLRSQGADYLVLPTKHSHEATGFFDYAEFLGLQDNPEVPLRPVVSFENDYDDWKRGAAPTWNALPAVTIYRLAWSER